MMWCRSGSACCTTFRRAASLFADAAATRASTRSPRQVGLDREVEFVEDHAPRAALGPRSTTSSARSPSSMPAAPIAIVGAVDLPNNALIARTAVRRRPRLPADQLLPAVSARGRRGCSTTRWDRSRRSRPLLAARHAGARACAARAVVFDQSARRPAGTAECFEAARAPARSSKSTGTASISSLAEDAVDPLDAPCGAGNPDVLVYFGLGVSSRAGRPRPDGSRLGSSRAGELGTHVRVRAAPTGVTATRAWEYIDTPLPTTTANGPR